MDIYVQSQIGACDEFVAEPKGKKEPVSVVISPLKVIGGDNSSIRITSGCNLWQACHNQRCYFSAAARKLPKIVGAGT